jgi:hypothetical protein
MRNIAVVLVLAGLVAAVTSPARPSPAPLGPNQQRLVQILIRSYPDDLAGYEGALLKWRDGSVTTIEAGRSDRSPEVILDRPTVLDIFAWKYPLAASGFDQTPTTDPGRARPDGFFLKMYGACEDRSFQAHLKKVRWVGGRTIWATDVNHVDRQLGLVAADLEALGPRYAPYVWPISGTFNCRKIAGTDRRSMHAYAAAIDLDAAKTLYWRNPGSSSPGRGRWSAVPPVIIAVFEKHGFIWGGRWLHFDTGHFEFRPEIIAAAQ